VRTQHGARKVVNVASRGASATLALIIRRFDTCASMFAHGKHTQFWPITIGTQEKTHETLRSRAIFNPNRFIASPLHGDNPKCTSSLPRALRLRNFGRSQMTLNARANKLRHAVLLHGGLASRCLSTERHGVMLFVCTAKGRLDDVASRGLSMRRFGVAQCLHGDLASCGQLKT